MYETSLQAIVKAAREAAAAMQLFSAEIKNKALREMAAALLAGQSDIERANQKDMAIAKEKGLSDAMLDRLFLNPDRIQSMATSLNQIANLPDPVGKILAAFTPPNGLYISRVSVPIGVIAVVYESRPNVTSDAAGLCLKSGNAVILRGGSESFHSTHAILAALHQGLSKAKVPTTAFQMLPTTDREALTALLKMDKEIDLLIPRGGPDLIEYVNKTTQIPLLQHLAGLCHTYIHEKADPQMALDIVMNAKLRRTGICGATEVLLVDRAIVQTHLIPILDALLKAHCEIRGDDIVAALDARVKKATTTDYDTEFLAPILAVKVVEDLNTAILHIEQHGTHHTDAIITNDEAAAETFLQNVNSAIVMHNTSTQFADGGEFGMGAEMGIATGKLHARGPVGAEQLTTYKYIVHGHGELRA